MEIKSNAPAVQCRQSLRQEGTSQGFSQVLDEGKKLKFCSGLSWAEGHQ